jgi:hypothetical protein
LKQLFDAASNLGLDQAALNDLLARSPSATSSRAPKRRHDSQSVVESQPIATRSHLSIAGARSPIASSRPSIDSRPSLDSVVRKLDDTPSQRLSPFQSAVSEDGNTVVRRTLIFPSDAKLASTDNTPIRKPSKKGRRTSGGSLSVTSARSVHDRVPTPPPPRSPMQNMFIDKFSPPVPHLPHSLASQSEAMLRPPQTSRDGKSTSAYDSLCVSPASPSS